MQTCSSLSNMASLWVPLCLESTSDRPALGQYQHLETHDCTFDISLAWIPNFRVRPFWLPGGKFKTLGICDIFTHWGKVNCHMLLFLLLTSGQLSSQNSQATAIRSGSWTTHSKNMSSKTLTGSHKDRRAGIHTHIHKRWGVCTLIAHHLSSFLQCC